MPNSHTDPRPHTFAECAALLNQSRPRHVIGNHTRLEEHRSFNRDTWSYTDGEILGYVVRYQNETIIEFHPNGHITLYRPEYSRAVIERMNRYLPNGYYANGRWGDMYLHPPWVDGRRPHYVSLENGITLLPSSSGDGTYWLDDLDDELMRMAEAI